ncbi:MAG: hypothetical protein IJZ79_01830 [Bacilli bacterium]|nr:hypothetical protein [Bacilli bacterium]
MKTNDDKYAFFILSNNSIVKVPYQGDLIKTTEKCKELYGEIGFLDSISKISRNDK